MPKAAAAGSIEKPILKRDFSVVDKKYLPLDDTVLYVTSDKTNTEVTMWNPTMLHNIGYLLSVESSWNFGLPLTFYIDNPYVKRAEIDTLLSKEIHATNTIILPPIDPYHQGYGLHFIARTMGGITSETALHDVSAYPIPFNFLKELKLSYRPSLAGQTPHMAPDAERITPALYKVTIDSKTSGYIYFDQMYQDGWKAMYGCRLYILNCKFLEHVKVNNWANGWKLPPNISQPTTIAIFFWPQYLEFVGLLLFVLTTFFFIYKNDTRVNREKTVRTVRNFFRVLKSFYSKVLYIVKEEV